MINNFENSVIFYWVFDRLQKSNPFGDIPPFSPNFPFFFATSMKGDKKGYKSHPFWKPGFRLTHVLVVHQRDISESLSSVYFGTNLKQQFEAT